MHRLSERRWTCAVLAGLVLLTLVCSAAGVAVFTWSQLRSDAPRQASVDRIAYVGADNNVYTVDRQGGSRQAITSDAETPTSEGGRIYRFPTWSPDSRRLAFVGIEASRDEPQTNTLYSALVDGGEPDNLFSSQESAPFYLYWAPDARQLAFLADETSGLSLRLATVEGENQLLDTGSPFYFTWSPDSATLVTHVGGAEPPARIGRLDIQTSRSQTLVDTPAIFLSPAWSPTDDTVLFAAELDDNRPALYLADDQGEPQRALVKYAGAISFGWSPQGDRLAYIVTDQPQPAGLGQFAFGAVWVIDRDGGAGRMVSTANAIAFFWAPDGKQIAYLAAVAGNDQRQGRLIPTSTAQQANGFWLQWRVIDLRSDEDRAVTTFMPAPGFLAALPFFDQYAQSLTFWAPDSTALVYSARGQDESAGLWVVTVDGQTPPQRLADGDFPAWSWQ